VEHDAPQVALAREPLDVLERVAERANQLIREL